MNKKGFLDWFFIIVMLFATFVVVILSLFVINKINDNGVFSEYDDAQTVIDKTRSAILGFDNLMLFLLVGLSIFVLVSSALVFNHPAYFFVGILLLFIAVVVSASVSNTFWIFTNSDAIAPTAALYPKMTFIMNNFPIYILFMGIAATVTMFISYRRQ